MGNFRIGDTVEWTSQSLGFTSTKRGEVVCIVPEGKRPAQYRQPAETRHMLNDLGVDHTAYRLDPLGGGYSRDHESYLVAVPGRPQDCDNKPKLYWPRVSNLERVEE